MLGATEARRRGAAATAVLLSATAWVAAGPPVTPARAAALSVNSTADLVDATQGDGICSTGNTIQVGGAAVEECTLRAAVLEANALPGADTIHLPAGTYTLTRARAPHENGLIPDAEGGDLDLTGSVVLDGAGEESTIVRAGTSPYEGIDRVFENWNPGTVSALRDVTIANGDPGGGFQVDLGGGVRNNGPATLTLERVTVTGNEAYCVGGGVFNWNTTGEAANPGTLHVVSSTISGNRAVGACGNGHAGAIRSEGAGSTLTITDSVIESNTAGSGTGGVGVSGAGGTITRTTFRNNVAGEGVGALFSDAAVSIAGSTFEGNRANAGDGGAILLIGSSASSITGSDVVNNTASGNGGGILSASPLTIERSTVAGNTARQGGGLQKFGPGTLTIQRSTFSGNSATHGFGGGIDMCCEAATAALTNSTFSGNSAALGGGAISILGPTMNLTNVTVAGNSAGGGGAGINGNGSSTWNLRNTILADSVGGPDCNVPVSASHSLIEDPTGCAVTDLGGSITGVDPQLLGLADNDGDTPTHDLAATSPAIDAGTNAGCPGTDQRGAPRPFDGPDAGTTATCDIGSVERGSPIPAGAPPYRLEVLKEGTGTGFVNGREGIACGSVCSQSFDEATVATLEATADPGSTFTGWSGACSGIGECKVVVTADVVVTAHFVKNTYALTVTRAGNGGGAVSSSPGGISCGATCADTFVHGDTVTLLANAANGSEFSGWSGACAGTDLTCEVTMTEARAVTATFTQVRVPPRTFDLGVTLTGNGSGRVTSDPAGIDCGADCSQTYEAGTQVTLAAAPRPGSAFAGWSGACTGIGACTVTMESARAVAAEFTVQAAPGAPDLDADGVPDSGDNCVRAPNRDQADRDEDGTGDACDDPDGDGVPDATDNCPDDANASQADADEDGTGDPCDETDDADTDGDGVTDTEDNCPDRENPGQEDADGDTVGDACDDSPLPVIPTELGIRYSPRTKVLSGSVTDAGSNERTLAQSDATCTAGREVVVKKVKAGKDRIVARTKTGDRGRWRVRGFDRHGTFYARAPRAETAEATCAASASARITL